ncbi:MAG: DUF1269 domain-containing protein, partial [Actinomycetia bacterium]|nr:DUF1269 domain-containing protein [Actinomycetes bacterium]
VAFDDELKADEGLIAAMRRQMDGYLQMRDAAIAVKTKRGRLRVRQTTEISTRRRQTDEGWWGLLITLLVGGPMGDNQYGEVFATMYGRLSQLGLDAMFTTELSETLEPGHSALCLLVYQRDLKPTLAEMGQLGGRVLHTPLAEHSVETIRERLRETRP